MTNIDQFESVFRSADKAQFGYEKISFAHVLTVTDLDANAAADLAQNVRNFLGAIDGAETVWSQLGGSDYSDVGTLLDQIKEFGPDLIVTYRHLQTDAWQWPYSLGGYLDVLTQAIETPVLVLPHPDAAHALPHSVQNTDRVMAIADHLTGDSRLVNFALAFTAPGGRCWLTHVESGAEFDRHLETIAKIPAIETEGAREAIEAQLLKEPHDFTRSCAETIKAEDVAVEIEELVTMGRRLEEYRRLIDQHQIDLLVFNTKDEDQLAMHGLAYPLAVELRSIPLLML